MKPLAFIRLWRKIARGLFFTMKKLITYITLSAFLIQGTGIATQLSTINNKLSTKHTLRPMAAARNILPLQDSILTVRND